MGVPISQMWAVASYVLKQKIKGNKRYPLILMLEPLYRCNLACAGCGKIQYPAHILKKNLTVEECMQATDESGCPIVSIPGGEPLMHPEIEKIVEGLIARKKYIYLCTNALLLRKKKHLFRPSKYLTFSVHMDGDEEDHDFAVCREGTFTEAEEAIRECVKEGFRVTTNTTLFDNCDVDRTRKFFDRMMELNVEAMMLSPGYSYNKAPDQSNFLRREKTFQLFRDLFDQNKKSWRFSQSPVFLEFLMGKRHLECTPWGNATYNVFGWQKPCYLLQEGYAKTFGEYMEETDFDNYGRASGNPKCQNCMVHCGYESTAVDYTFSSWKGFGETIRAVLFKISGEKGRNIEPPPVKGFVETGLEAQKNKDSIAAQLQDAVDFRGDVTIRLKDGKNHEGYLFNFTKNTAEFFPKNSGEKGCVFIEEIVRIEKSGRDTASGRSWETWMAKYKARKEAIARGEAKDFADIEPKPEVV